MSDMNARTVRQHVADAIAERMDQLGAEVILKRRQEVAEDLADLALEAIGVRLCTGEDHGYCCPGHYIEQPDGSAIHRTDLLVLQELEAWR